MSKLVIVLCSVLFISAAKASLWSDAVKTGQHKAQKEINGEILQIEREVKSTKEKALKKFRSIFNGKITLADVILATARELMPNTTTAISKLAGSVVDANISECIESSAYIVDNAKAALLSLSACITDELKDELIVGYIESFDKVSEAVLPKLIQIRDEAQHCFDNVGSLESAVAAIFCAKVATVDAIWVSNKFDSEWTANVTKLNSLLEAFEDNYMYCSLKTEVLHFLESHSLGV